MALDLPDDFSLNDLYRGAPAGHAWQTTSRTVTVKQLRRLLWLTREGGFRHADEYDSLPNEIGRFHGVRYFLGAE